MSDNNKFLIQDKKSHDTGIQRIYKFDNGYGASVVKHKYSYGGDKGLWELAVIENIKEIIATPSPEPHTKPEIPIFR